MAAANRAVTKPYKLKPSGGDGTSISRDDLSTWDFNIRAYCRQSGWGQFLPGGARRNWDPNVAGYGFQVLDAAGEVHAANTQTLRDNFNDFQTCLATNCPAGFLETILRESTSYQWILNELKNAFNLNSKGASFLEGDNMTFEYSEMFSYQQGYFQLKDFYLSALLRTGTNFKGVALAQDERLSPATEQFIVKEWLRGIDPRLPNHIALKSYAPSRFLGSNSSSCIGRKAHQITTNCYTL